MRLAARCDAIEVGAAREVRCIPKQRLDVTVVDGNDGSPHCERRGYDCRNRDTAGRVCVENEVLNPSALPKLCFFAPSRLASALTTSRTASILAQINPREPFLQEDR